VRIVSIGHRRASGRAPLKMAGSVPDVAFKK